ncbi:Bug family tripartite tricarboxylate transporter substrate binding protein [Ottowia thiooxydans]|uniref:Bug family tripartite tricarboxylate transporter substrate binding protein n=1 Tax=Ottowia thiooxydans TaxID=219182 RepID=UPI00041ED0A5|nr:tripartite tricarboxylate transporter substrate-binding protein [Ottowia thiooxydans]
MNRRNFCIAASALALPMGSVWAATGYPTRPVRVIVPYAAGGGPDVLMRQMAPAIGDALGQTIVIENKVGAAGVLAAQFVAAAPADGYTLLMGASTHLILKILQPSLGFDPLKDFAFAGNMSTSPSILIVPSDSPYKNIDQLAAAAKAAPGKFNYGSGGVGTGAHLAAATFAALKGLQVVHIPLRGSVEITASLLRGDTQFAFPTAGTAVPQVKGGKVRALAVTSTKRLPELPDVPTMNELTRDPLTIQESWSGLWAPAKTPPDIINRIHAAVNSALKAPAVQAKARDGGSEVETSESPASYSAFVHAENSKWAEIIRKGNVTGG